MTPPELAGRPEEGFTAQEWDAGADACSRLVGSIWQDRPTQKPSEYAEKRRLLPIGTPFPGPWRNTRTPYLVEPMDNMSPLSPIQHTVVMKGGQIGFTAAAENVTAFWIDVFPAQILFISATEALLKKWAIKRLDPLIDGCGFRDKIFSQSTNKMSRRTGDTIFTKEFAGGGLDMASAQAAASMRADTVRVLIRDEIDGAPRMLKTGEGNWLQVSIVRTNAWGDRRKVLDFSTPGTYDESNIWPSYQAGDQRKFFVPCPFCGKYQILEFGTDKSQHGLKWDTEGGYIVDAHYICEFCHEAISNDHKGGMLEQGRWEPMSRSYSPFVRSYQLSTLYSPIGMTTWREIAVKYLEAQEEPDGMRWFKNLFLGEPYRETGTTPKVAELVSELRGVYKPRQVPDGVLFITCGIRTWSLDYKVFPGAVDDENGGAWLALTDYARDKGFLFYRDDGFEFDTKLVFIDSGWNTSTVYSFCLGWGSTFPSKGFSFLQKQRNEKGDERIPNQFFKRYRHKNLGGGNVLYEISTNYYKTHLYYNLQKKRAEGDWSDQPAGFCEFPIDYPESYFRGLVAEEMRRDKSFHLVKGRRNEPQDCRVMALCAADVYLGLKIDELKAQFRAQGVPKEQLDQINHIMALDYLTQATARIIQVDTTPAGS
jgi:phage terminase large subunit GpA-like protein